MDRKSKDKPRGFRASCKICSKGIYGNDGTYAKGLGAAHKICVKDKKNLEVFV